MSTPPKEGPEGQRARPDGQHTAPDGQRTAPDGQRTPGGVPPTGPEGLRSLLIDAALSILDDPDTPLDLRKVAEEAGKSRTAPYLVFGKESEGGGLLALRIAVAAEGARMVSDRMEAAGSSTDDPLLAFRRVAAAFLTFVRERPRLFRLMYGPEIGVVSTLSAEGLKAHAEFGDLLHHRTVAERALTRAIEGCQSRRLLPRGSPTRYTLIAWASLIGVAFLLLDEVLGAAGLETEPEEAADLVIQSVMGLDAGVLDEATRSFLLAQTKSEHEAGAAPPDDVGPSQPKDALQHLWRTLDTRSAAPPPGEEMRPLADRLPVEEPPGTYRVLGASARARPLPGAPPPPADSMSPSEAVYRYGGLRRAVQSRAALQGARVLWVDDRPELVQAERATLEGLGMEVAAVRTTVEAERILRSAAFDVVISDLARPGDPHDGAPGLKRMREAGPDTPLVVYVDRLDADRGLPAHADGITNTMDELLHLVLDVLERRP